MRRIEEKSEDLMNLPWATPVIPRSKLLYAPNSLMHTSPYMTNIQKGLVSAGKLPEDFLPEELRDRLPDFNRLGWNARSDPLFNYLEEAADFGYQLWKLVFANRKTTRDLEETRRIPSENTRNVIQLLDLQACLYDPTAAWIKDFIGKDNLPIFLETFIAAMDSREARGAQPVVQPAGKVWSKLFAINDEEDRAGKKYKLPRAIRSLNNRCEMKELWEAAKALDNKEGESKHQEAVANLSHFLETPYTETDEFTFYRNLKTALTYHFNPILEGTGVDLSGIIRLALSKQFLRMEIGKKLRAHFAGTDFDTRAATKIISQLYLPFLISQILPQTT